MFPADPAQVPDEALTPNINDATEADQQSEQNDINNPKTLQKIIDNNGVDQGAIDTASAKLNTTLLQKALGFGDPLLQLSLIGCTIYGGSLQQSKATVDNQVNQQRATFYYLESAANQQQRGSLDASTSNELSSAVGATNSDLGNINDSNPIIRASGSTPDTTNSISAEAGSSGSHVYSLLDALGITNNLVGKWINSLMDTMCPLMTSNVTAGAIAAASLAFSIGSFGVSDAGTQALADGASAFVRAYASHVAESIFGDVTTKDGIKVITKSFIARARPYIAKQGLILGGTAGLTVLAHIITFSKARTLQGGLNQGPDLANEGDAGGNVVSNDLEQSQLFGRPLLENEVCASNQEDKAYLSYVTSKRSAYDRLLSPNVAESLLSRTAMSIDAHANLSSVGAIATMGDYILQPLSAFSSIVSLFTGIAGAAPNCNADSTDYGNVQFGWSAGEENLINNGNPADASTTDNETSYMPFENQQVLDNNPGKEQQIAQKYAICFGYKYNPSGDGSLDPTDTGGNLVLDSAPGGTASIGTLLADRDIAVDTHGNAINGGGLCDPANLSYTSTDPLAADSDNSSPQANDLILRWRLAMQNDTTIYEMHNLQNVSQN